MFQPPAAPSRTIDHPESPTSIARHTPAPAARLTASARPHRLQVESAGNREPAKLLLVEDDQDTRMLLAAQLQDLGFSILSAASGDEGLARCREQAPDLMLLDVNMPAPDGFAVLRAVKTDAHLSQIPVFMLSGRADAASKAAAFRLGAHDYLTKPVERTELGARIRRHLELARDTRVLKQRLDAYQARFGALDDPARQHQGGDANARDSDRLCRARDLIEAHLAQPLSAAELASAVGLSQRALARGFAALFGSSLHAYLREARLQCAKRLLVQTDLLVKAIALEVGYRQTSDLTRAMRARFGATPTALRVAGRGNAAADSHAS